MNKLRVFIASSTESKFIASKISDKLKSEFIIKEWFGESIFSLSSTPIESLEELRYNFDAIIVISNFEDKIIKRGKELNSIRDNLIFEFALGIGYFGRENSILVLPSNIKFTTFPSDILGMTFMYYDENSEGLNSLENVSQRIVLHLNEKNNIVYPKIGNFGVNVLNKENFELKAGEYSFCAVVPYSKKMEIKLLCMGDLEIAWPISKKYGIHYEMFDVINKTQNVTNVPIFGKEVDAQLSLKNTGRLKIEYIENGIITDTRMINIL